MSKKIHVRPGKGQSKFGFTDKQIDSHVIERVNYIFRQSGYAGGMTPLLDREGS